MREKGGRFAQEISFSAHAVGRNAGEPREKVFSQHYPKARAKAYFSRKINPNSGGQEPHRKFLDKAMRSLFHRPRHG
jgi:hypothetical protein